MGPTWPRQYRRGARADVGTAAVCGTAACGERAGELLLSEGAGQGVEAAAESGVLRRGGRQSQGGWREYPYGGCHSVVSGPANFLHEMAGLAAHRSVTPPPTSNMSPSSSLQALGLAAGRADA
ncbi:unnamed protein product [Prorocentrum cordatum]|uniref:Uncharacterized protein n=1 Tax=Prorocentrum cordatum TaxID=2364126 RepID=A0ABN9RPV7_9DINO|nr:unnamed protein product [Polarella glacialis]